MYRPSRPTNRLMEPDTAFNVHDKDTDGMTDVCVLTDCEVWSLDQMIVRVRRGWAENERRARVYHWHRQGREPRSREELRGQGMDMHR